MKVAVYTITKNEEKFIARWADSCRDADFRLVVDTGSIDNTAHVAKLAGCQVYPIAVSPWRFDDARNAALALVPKDIDICIALDADEVLTSGWRESLEKVNPDVTRPRYKYVWSWAGEGKEGLVYSGDKIHARNGYRWTHPVHEVLTPVIPEVQGWVDLEIHHHPDSTKSRSQYLPLLELAVRERPDDDRNRFYLGREFMFNGRNEEAKVHFLRHLELSTWAPERATCMRYMGRVTGDKEKWTLMACGEAPNRREPWVDLAFLYYTQKRWEQCLSACVRALEIQEKPLEYLCEQEAWGALPYDLAGIAAWNLHMHEKALMYTEIAVQLDLSDTRVRNNLLMIQKSLNTSEEENSGP
jgi:tetratricopeptide (TPR) repeat protein